MMRTTASELAAASFHGEIAKGMPVTQGETCSACGTDLKGSGSVYAPPKTFNDIHHFANPAGTHVCGSCATLLTSSVATAGYSGSGVVSAAGFGRLLSNKERLAFLMSPPEPPFAVAIITAQRQHVWWMARVAYDRDLIPLQFGHRPLIINRPRAIEAADAMLAYEAAKIEVDKKPTYVFIPLDRELKSGNDGQFTYRFQMDDGNHAKALKAQLVQLSLGDLWAAAQLRAAARELKADTTQAALTALNAPTI